MAQTHQKLTLYFVLWHAICIPRNLFRKSLFWHTFCIKKKRFLF